ncbi:acyl-CoA reductase [Croceitalea rosinachiae]|uniref:Acyl-CoA reductase n=1 Tax=Croceitalea rosinachiae TaxID=3075596 RepID=A0ABU3ABC4_9FLAO|nr:acyl-CoA reductase [Croceitalea sp. F388]MDT0607459.1 acyl-CoA reductase [Croceitalea sp. F388]
MPVQPHILDAFIKLGNFLRDFCENKQSETNPWAIKLNDAITKVGHQNGWFTRPNVINALVSWGELLTKEKINLWLSDYDDLDKGAQTTVAIIMAGNIPLVGFHDFLSVLITGNKVITKLSSNDSILLPFIAEFLIDIAPSLKESIQFTQDKLEGFNAVIATGSNNTSRYFDYYFGKYPNIIRKNRSSIAVLTGAETKEQLNELGKDIFQYFGLGCRSVSKLFVPKDYDFRVFFESIFDYQDIINTHKYANNYDYNKAVFLMSDFKIFDNNFLLLKEDVAYASPIGTLYYEYYDDLDTLNKKLLNDAQELQCVVAGSEISNSIPFGSTQDPGLNDYADRVDTIDFLLKL